MERLGPEAQRRKLDSTGTICAETESQRVRSGLILPVSAQLAAQHRSQSAACQTPEHTAQAAGGCEASGAGMVLSVTVTEGSLPRHAKMRRFQVGREKKSPV